MEALQAAAERKGRTVSEVANEVIREWHEPSSWWSDDDEPIEPLPHIELPSVGTTYIATKCDNLPITVKAVKPYGEFRPTSLPHFITIEHPCGEDGQEWEEDTVADDARASLVESTGLTLEEQPT